jgi:cytochrome d ubiquinol oxidase subunit I
VDSLLVGFSPHTKVTGLDSVAPADRPPALTLLHLSFDAMVGLAFLLLLAGLRALLAWYRRRALPRQPWFWWLGVICGPAALVAMECGSIVTEVGRQPWVVYQLMTTSQAATTNGGVLRQPDRGDRPVRGARRGHRDDLAVAVTPLAAGGGP